MECFFVPIRAGVEKDETIEGALRREIKEELNMKVLSWEPLGYQRVSDDEGNVGYQIRVHADLEIIGKFEEDPGGSVIGYDLVPLEDVNTRIQYGDVGDWLVEKVRRIYATKAQS